jgi:hypothetical protein
MNFLTRLRGLQAPVALDEPLRLQDGFSGVITPGGGSGSTILISRDRAQRREPHRPPGGTPAPASAATSTAGPTILIARNMRDARRQMNRPPGSPPFVIPASGVTPGTYNTANITVGADGRVTGAANGTVLATAAPGLIPDLAFWFESDDINMANGASITRLRDRTPWIGGVVATQPDGSGICTVATAALNSLNGLAWPGTSPRAYTMTNYWQICPAAATIFGVIKMATSTGTQALIGGASGGLAVYMVGTSGTAKIALTKTAVAVLAPATNAWTVGTPFQFNATYTASTGAYAYRQARTANGSGTTSTGAGGLAAATVFGADFNPTSSPLNGATVFATIVYNRVLTSTEITNVENYLLAKWGV